MEPHLQGVPRTDATGNCTGRRLNQQSALGTKRELKTGPRLPTALGVLTVEERRLRWSHVPSASNDPWKFKAVGKEGTYRGNVYKSGKRFNRMGEQEGWTSEEGRWGSGAKRVEGLSSF
ncbi:hypothetical protein FB451DRAFT_1169023 [Mycena latifolia]|nr:hypothetical protein FB451DRAFT_1169023 [Mycena latifolia]